jgi:hypothetical protein
MDSSSLTPLGTLLQRAVTNIARYDQHLEQKSTEQTIHVPNTGNVLLHAYEQLRNASENIEDHLLFQNAIKRFYKRNLPFAIHKRPKDLGHELIIELTQAEYLQNDTVPLSLVTQLDTLITDLYEAYWQITRHDSALTSETTQRWILEILTVKSEQLFHNPIRLLSFATFAHTHLSERIAVEDFLVSGETIDTGDYPVVLYLAVHKALLKSNDANARNSLYDLYSVSPANIQLFIDFNKKYDNLAGSKTTAKIARIISRNGAPLRIIRSAFFSKKEEHIPDTINTRTLVLNHLEATIDAEYRLVRHTMKLGVIKSIIFLLITKALIGLIIEVPYDLAVTGSIVLLPLIVNLLFPPVFIAATALTFRMPSAANKKALVDYIDTLLYSPQAAIRHLKPPQTVGRAYLFNTLYVAMFIVVFYLVADRLATLGFNIVQGIIFFIFLSPASFLGYRLTVQITELEIVTTYQGFIAILRDFLYAPFIFVGRRISYRFSQMNIIAQILDIIIELPLKTTLKLLRQWTIFLNNKKDELL